MTAHSARAMGCACGQLILFPEFHWPHCSKNPLNMNRAARASLPFTKSELAKIATHGPMADRPIGKKHGAKHNGRKKAGR